ncbi:MAG: hypothetical protein CMP91_01805 [Gammaproteobacteria bacterium]|nr:hypothetical protein [Gammaproteobacteria bacterium]|tara:strand:+ start:36188 stop:36625 length:438 start_codon:yes stop_codon:yes gene_type:complete
MADENILIVSQIDGDFEGFDDEVLFKLMNGTYWIQDEYQYWYHYAYCPAIEILNIGGRPNLRVRGQEVSVPVRQIDDVIESQINGEFSGWEGETEYELTNGQVWKQSSYSYEYTYSYMPEVLIYSAGGGYRMQVEGTSAEVTRIK